MRVVAFGDVHIGNIMSDVISFSRLMEWALKDGEADAVLIIGDVIDGAFKYQTQSFYQSSIRTIDVQRVLFRWLVIDRVLELRPDVELVIVRGNHDTNFVEDFLRPVFTGLDIRYSYVDRVIIDGVLYVHYLLRRSRGSYATSITPMMVSMAQSFLRHNGAEKLVFGHIHRGVSHLIVGGYEIVSLPSFMRYTDAKDVFYSPCVAVVDDGEISFKCVKERPVVKDVQLTNVDLIDRAVKSIIMGEDSVYV